MFNAKIGEALTGFLSEKLKTPIKLTGVKKQEVTMILTVNFRFRFFFF